MNIPMLSLAGVHLDNTMASVGPATAKQLSNLSAFGFGAGGVSALLSARQLNPSALQPLLSARQEQLVSARVQDPMYQQLQTSHQLLQRRMQMVLEELQQVTTQVEDLRDKKKQKQQELAAETAAAGAALDGTMGEAALLGRERAPHEGEEAATRGDAEAPPLPLPRAPTEKEQQIETLRQQLAEKDRMIETMLLEREGQEEEAARAAARQGDADYQHELEMQRLLQELLRLDSSYDTSATVEHQAATATAIPPSLPSATAATPFRGGEVGASAAFGEDEEGLAAAASAAAADSNDGLAETPSVGAAAAGPSPLAVRRRQSMSAVSGVKPRGRQPTARREVVAAAAPRATSASVVLLEELEAYTRIELESVAAIAGVSSRQMLHELHAKFEALADKALQQQKWYSCMRLGTKP